MTANERKKEIKKKERKIENEKDFSLVNYQKIAKKSKEKKEQQNCHACKEWYEIEWMICSC